MLGEDSTNYVSCENAAQPDLSHLKKAMAEAQMAGAGTQGYLGAKLFIPPIPPHNWRDALYAKRRQLQGQLDNIDKALSFIQNDPAFQSYEFVSQIVHERDI